MVVDIIQGATAGIALGVPVSWVLLWVWRAKLAMAELKQVRKELGI